MTPSQISTLISFLAGAVGLVLELLGVPGASVAGLVAGALGVRRPGDVPAPARSVPSSVKVRAGRPAPGSMGHEVEKILGEAGDGVLR